MQSIFSAEEEKTAAIGAGLPLVQKLAEEYAGRGISSDDLIQIGCIGLIRAIDSGEDAETMIRKEFVRAQNPR